MQPVSGLEVEVMLFVQAILAGAGLFLVYDVLRVNRRIKMSAKKRKRKNAGTVSITIIVLAFLAVMAVQICKLKQKDSDYQAKEAELQQEKQDETQRSSELDDLEEYMKSSQYIEDVAKSKLGLTYKNEIIFKEKEK